ncbi:AAA family ATPase [Parasphingorhabdus sp.]|uniref:AAA family ATPase n=1 Tax=Parasphingorhabdus sp. TaxID=2709688 RepID=UPI002F944E60
MPRDLNAASADVAVDLFGYFDCELSPLSDHPSPQEVEQRTGIKATPYHWPAPQTIEPRDWIFGRWILRGELTTVISPGGVGKSGLLTASALSLASGINIIGIAPYSGPQTVWLWNLEDDRIELNRQVAANSIAHSISPEGCADRLYVDSGIDQRLCMAIEGPEGFMIVEPVFDALLEELKARKIDVLIIDPFVSSHQISENDNGKIDAIAKSWKRLAQAAGCAVVLAHHSRKSNGQETTVEDSRGASSLGDAARVSLVLNRLNKTEAQAFGVTDDSERSVIFRVNHGKSSRSPPENASWFQMQSTNLGNSRPDKPADEVGVVMLWKPPDLLDGVTNGHLKQVQRLVDKGDYRESQQSPDWIGNAVAEVLGWDMEAPNQKAKIRSILKIWIENRKFKVEKRQDKTRKMKSFMVVDEWSVS